MTTVIDVTWPLSEALATEGGAMVEFVRDNDYDGSLGLRSHWIRIHNHVGTHVETSAHVTPGGKNIDEVAPADLVGPGVLLDLAHCRKPDYAIGVDDVRLAEAKVPGGVQRGDFAILRTGWYHTFGTPTYWTTSPYLQPDAARYLVDERGVRGLGYDFSQEGAGRDHDEARARMASGELKPGEAAIIHHIVLDPGLYQVEHMANLDAVTASRFQIVVAPLRLAGLEAAACRVLVIQE